MVMPKKLSKIISGEPELRDGNQKPEPRSWQMSHLPKPSTDEIADLFNIMTAWLNERSWSPSLTSNRETIFEYAERHGFSGAIGAMAIANRVKSDRLAQWGKSRYFSNCLHHEKSMAVCRKMQKKAIEIQAPFTVIKGPALNKNVYRDAGVRSHSDIDVLVSSRSDALRLILSLNLKEKRNSRRKGLGKRFIQPGRLHVMYQGWEIEFMHPIPWPCDPMFEVLNRHRNRLLRIPDSASILSTPDPDMHLLLLIAHTSIHICFRLIWFLDIVVMIRRYRDVIDFDWIEKEIDRMQLRNMAACITRFCRIYLDSGIHEIKHRQEGWNTPMQQAITSVGQIQGAISVYHTEGWRRYFAPVLSFTRFFLITDAGRQFSKSPSNARKWLVNRTMNALRWKSMRLHRLLDGVLVVISLVIPPIFRIYLSGQQSALTKAAPHPAASRRTVCQKDRN